MKQQVPGLMHSLRKGRGEGRGKEGGGEKRYREKGEEGKVGGRWKRKEGKRK